jgi:hypothetical protein
MAGTSLRLLLTGIVAVILFEQRLKKLLSRSVAPGIPRLWSRANRSVPVIIT